MRSAFVEQLTSLASTNENVIFLTADLGFGVFEDFASKYPSQFLNVGVSEQNMIGVASGMALEGRKVFAYSIGNFPTLRCLEQIRNDICYHNLDVTVVSVGAGFSYGQLGMSHFATEDVGVMNAIPGIDIYTPSDPWQIPYIFHSISSSAKPSYLRLDKSVGGIPETIVSDSGLYQLGDSGEVLLITIGGITEEAIAAKHNLASIGIDCTIAAVTTFKPFPQDHLLPLLRRFKHVFTLEEHTVNGGLFSQTSKLAFSHSLDCIGHPLAIPDCYPTVVGDQLYLRRYFQLDADSISAFILQTLN